MLKHSIRDSEKNADAVVLAAHQKMALTYAELGQSFNLPQPVTEGTATTISHIPDWYDAFWNHPDHWGSSSYITDMNGVVTQHMEYLPYCLRRAQREKGTQLVDEHQNSPNTPFKFNGKELDDETGNYYYGARYYDPKTSIWLSVDPLAEEYQGFSSYAYTMNNPVKFVDPDVRSTGVRQLEDGTYKVIKGDLNDGNTGVYLVDENGNYDIESSEMIGESLTTHSFFDENDKLVKGAIIDMNSCEGQEFINDLAEEDPFIVDYMINATNGEDYDFKATGTDESMAASEKRKHYYRGSILNNGKIVSARDVRNIGAGFVAGRAGLSWSWARAGFDTYQGYKSYGIFEIPSLRPGLPNVPTIIPDPEPMTTQKAQAYGFILGTLQRTKD